MGGGYKRQRIREGENQAGMGKVWLEQNKYGNHYRRKVIPKESQTQRTETQRMQYFERENPAIEIARKNKWCDQKSDENKVNDRVNIYVDGYIVFRYTISCPLLWQFHFTVYYSRPQKTVSFLEIRHNP